MKTIESKIRAFAGAVVLTSIVLGYYVSPYWYLLNIFVGLNLFQSSMTGFCPLEIALRKMEKKS